LHPLWNRRFSTKFNGVSYVVQRGAEAVYSEQGQAQVKALIDHYMGNAAILTEALLSTGLEVFGGRNAPYVWVRTPDGYNSWQVFDKILRDLRVVVTPGAGFGAQGEGYFRVSAFNSVENAREVARRFKALRW
jgi:LL-diaminopimelate aminotransferase